VTSHVKNRSGKVNPVILTDAPNADLRIHPSPQITRKNKEPPKTPMAPKNPFLFGVLGAFGGFPGCSSKNNKHRICLCFLRASAPLREHSFFDGRSSIHAGCPLLSQCRRANTQNL
jgi:hypothetical protein